MTSKRVYPSEDKIAELLHNFENVRIKGESVGSVMLKKINLKPTLKDNKVQV